MRLTVQPGGKWERASSRTDWFSGKARVSISLRAWRRGAPRASGERNTAARLAQSFQEQVNDQKAQVETLKQALFKLEQKLDEAKSKREVLLARHRRSIAMDRAAKAQVAIGDGSKSASFDRLKERVTHTEAAASAEIELLNDDAAEKLNRLDRDAEVERLLLNLKTRRGLPEKVG